MENPKKQFLLSLATKINGKMDSYPIIKRLALTIERLREQPPPTLKKIVDFLREKGFEISTRTLQRDFERLKDDFNLDIERKGNTYSVPEENSQRSDALTRIIGLAHTSELLQQGIKDKKELLSLISFQHDVGSCAGAQHFEALYSAIKNCKVVTIEHKNFDKNKISTHEVKPLLLKEYGNRWYLVAVHIALNEVRTYGLDRIKKVAVEKARFDAKEREKALALFDNVIGLVYDMSLPTTVKLAVSSSQAKHFKSVPLHHSQQEETETKDEVIFSYFLAPNRELQRLILGYGSQVRVLAPKEFATQVEQEVKEMLKKYKV
jgi:predicted DNA-binding transcriptional regulator YafY